MKTTLTATLTVFLLANGPQIFASEEHEHKEEHTSHHEKTEHKDQHDHDDGQAHNDEAERKDQHDHEEDDEKENSSQIDDDMAQQVGIVTAKASSKTLHETVKAYGSLTAGPEQYSQIQARFDGMVKSVKVNIGDKVNAGDLLAEVESNESLKTYRIRAPISGLIVERFANKGEVTQDQVLLSVMNMDSIWAELRVYPIQQSSINQGQSVQIYANKQSMKTTVNHVVPVLDKPYQLARVRLDNTQLKLSPGLLVEARIEIGSYPVDLAVSKVAIQTIGDRQGVFVKHDENYEFTPLILGKSDDHFVEVIGGLQDNSEYVSENSYLVKSDIEKSEAEHEH